MNRRWLALLVPAALVGAVVADQGRPEPAPAQFGSRLGLPGPAVRVDPRLSSTWYCPGAPARAAGDGTISILNPGLDPVVTTLTVFENEVAETAATTVTVPPGEVLGIDLFELRPSDMNAVLVEAVGGEVVVEQQIRTSIGIGGSACASDVATNWYFAEGSTDDAPDGAGASYRLMVFNPFVADAVVDVSYVTPEGPAFAQDTEAMVIPGRSLRVINLNEAIRREAQLAVAVATRSGSVVIGRLLTYDGTGSRQGVLASVASPTLATTWWFPGGGVDDGVTERVVISNPNEDRAELELNVYPADPGAGVPVPLAVSVAPASSVVIDAASIQGMVPGPHAVQVESLNGVAVMAERVVDDSSGEFRRSSAVVGAHTTSTQWYLGFGASSAAIDGQVLAVANPTGTPVTVEIRQLVAGGASREVAVVELGPAAMARVSLGEVTDASVVALWVRADTPVVVERKLRDGVPWAMAVPAL